MSLGTEVPEILFQEMREFILSNTTWDQSSLLSSALTKSLERNCKTWKSNKNLSDPFSYQIDHSIYVEKNQLR